MPRIQMRNGKVVITHDTGEREFDSAREAIAWCQQLRNRALEATLAADVIEREIRGRAWGEVGLDVAAR